MNEKDNKRLGLATYVFAAFGFILAAAACAFVGPVGDWKDFAPINLLISIPVCLGWSVIMGVIGGSFFYGKMN